MFPLTHPNTKTEDVCEDVITWVHIHHVNSTNNY